MDWVTLSFTVWSYYQSSSINYRVNRQEVAMQLWSRRCGLLSRRASTSYISHRQHLNMRQTLFAIYFQAVVLRVEGNPAVINESSMGTEDHATGERLTASVALSAFRRKNGGANEGGSTSLFLWTCDGVCLGEVGREGSPTHVPQVKSIFIMHLSMRKALVLSRTCPSDRKEDMKHDPSLPVVVAERMVSCAPTRAVHGILHALWRGRINRYHLLQIRCCMCTKRNRVSLPYSGVGDDVCFHPLQPGNAGGIATFYAHRGRGGASGTPGGGPFGRDGCARDGAWTPIRQALQPLQADG